MRRLAVPVAVAVLALATTQVALGAPTNLTYNGPDGGEWSDEGHWANITGADHFVPADGDTLYFPPALGDIVTENDIAGLSVFTLSLQAAGITVIGEELGIQNTVSALPAGTVTADLPLRADANIGLRADQAGTVLRLRTPGSAGEPALDLNGFTAEAISPGLVQIWGDVTGDGSLASDGDGELDIRAALGMTGQIVAGGGILRFGEGSPGDCGSAPDAEVAVVATIVGIECRVIFGSLDGDGAIKLVDVAENDDRPRLTLAMLADGVFEGGISGPANGRIICCTAGGELTLRLGEHSFAGALEVTAGSLILDRADFTARGPVSVAEALISGNMARIGALTVVGGVLAPGVPGDAGLFWPDSLTLGAGSTLRVDLLGIQPGEGGYDQVIAAGPVSIEGTALEVALGFTPEIGQSFTLLRGASSLAGQFEGLPEGAGLTIDGLFFALTYAGGESGRDIVLTRVAELPDPDPDPDPEFRLYVPFLAKAD